MMPSISAGSCISAPLGFTAKDGAAASSARTPRLRYSGASLGYQLASIIAGGPAPLIATALFAAFHSGYAIPIYIAACAVVSLISAAMMPDYTGQDIFNGI